MPVGENGVLFDKQKTTLIQYPTGNSRTDYIIPEGTTFTVHSTLREAITNLNVDEGERLKNIFIHLFLQYVFFFKLALF